jgi:penicillin-binding protein 2
MNGDKSILFKVFVFLISTIFVIRLFYLQLYDSRFKQLSANNILHVETVFPARGIVLDKNEKIVVENEPSYDFFIIPNQLKVLDTVSFLESFNLSLDELTYIFDKAKKYSAYKPSIFHRGMSHYEFAVIQNQFSSYEGIYHIAKPIRHYPNSQLAHLLGHVAEINLKQLNKDTSNYYKAGDLIGIGGIEKYYENVLRGNKGYELKIYDVKGQSAGSYNNSSNDSLVSNGKQLHLSVDSKLQLYIEKLLYGKIGSVVAIEPSSGNILAMASAPTFDPNFLTGKNYSKNYLLLQKDTLKPIFNRALMATYPPGSMFKLIQALIGLQENHVNYEDKIFIDHSNIGDLAPVGYYDLKKAIVKSSNNYFFKLFRKMINKMKDSNTYIDSRLGLIEWHDYIKKFGLGSSLSIDMPIVSSGFIPSYSYYDNLYGPNRWKFSNIYSLSIGQGELLVTPLQMANLAAIIANKGFFYTPKIVDKIDAIDIPIGDRIYTPIDTNHYNLIIDAMEEVVSLGSGRRAFMDYLTLCGKTSTVQNPHGYDHSGFIGFAPKEKPVIAISAYIENSGQGGRAAASIASLATEYYINKNVKRKWLEEYVLIGDFIDEEDKE